MSEKPEGELTENELSKLADMLVERMEKRRKERVEAKRKLAEKQAEREDAYAVCVECGKLLTDRQYSGSNCPFCGGTKARIITK